MNKAAQELGYLGGIKKSKAKAYASKNNGQKGGRPLSHKEKAMFRKLKPRGKLEDAIKDAAAIFYKGEACFKKLEKMLIREQNKISKMRKEKLIKTVNTKPWFESEDDSFAVRYQLKGKITILSQEKVSDKFGGSYRDMARQYSVTEVEEIKVPSSSGNIRHIKTFVRDENAGAEKLYKIYGHEIFPPGRLAIFWSDFKTAFRLRSLIWQLWKARGEPVEFRGEIVRLDLSTPLRLDIFTRSLNRVSRQPVPKKLIPYPQLAAIWKAYAGARIAELVVTHPTYKPFEQPDPRAVQNPKPQYPYST